MCYYNCRLEVIILENVNERITQAIELSGKKKVEIARKLNVSQPYISQLCAGQRQPSRRTLSDLAALLCVRYEWLAYGNGAMKSNAPKRQRLMDWIADVAKDDDTARFRIVETLMTLSEQEWEILERVAKKIADRDESPSA